MNPKLPPRKTQVAGPRIAPKYDKNNPTPTVVIPVESPEAEDEIFVIADVKPVEKKVEAAPPVKLAGIRDWHEAVGCVSAKRMRDCIIYQLDVIKDSWWSGKITTSGRGFLRNDKIAKLITDSTPDDFTYETDGPIGWRVKRQEGTEDKLVQKFVRRELRNEAERLRVRESLGVNNHTRKFLAKKDCPQCHGTAFRTVRPYPQAPALTMDAPCECVEE